MAQTLIVIVTIKTHKAGSDVKLTLKRTLDFTPWEGLVFRLANEAGDVLEIALDGIVYENDSRAFIVELEDDTLYESLCEQMREQGQQTYVLFQSKIQERITYYKDFGWE